LSLQATVNADLVSAMLPGGISSTLKEGAAPKSAGGVAAAVLPARLSGSLARL
jgi:hypothetical protein